MSKEFLETIEKMWQEKNDKITFLERLNEDKDAIILKLAEKFVEESDFDCIHTVKGYQGRMYCDDCPLRKLASSFPGTQLHNFCDKPKYWSK